MRIDFFKYHGAGNDFIIIDNQTNVFDRNNNKLIEQLCNRRFGIGSDGLMLLQKNTSADFEMVYFNSDGYEASMCGNGGRCIVALANHLGIIGKTTRFLAADGIHDAIVESQNYIKIKMIDVATVEQGKEYYYLNTGTPHFIKFVQDINGIDVVNEGREIRNNQRFKAEGTNVDFVEFKNEILYVRTYERGVENETLACGTGITASAIAACLHLNNNLTAFNVKALGGNLKVSFSHIENGNFENIWLEGPAEMVFKGEITF